MHPSTKRLSFYMALCLLASTLFACNPTPPPVETASRPAPPRQAEGSKGERFQAILERAAPIQQCNVLVIGDSIVEGLHKNYNDAEVFAAGIQSAGVNDWLNYAPELLKTIKPKAVILALGVNDSRISPARLPEFLDNYARLCGEIRGNGATLTVSTILPVRKGKGKRTRLGNRLDVAMIRQMNAGIVKIARAEKYGVIDSHAAMADARDMLPQALTFDGVHLTRDGYAKWENVLFRDKLTAQR